MQYNPAVCIIMGGFGSYFLIAGGLALKRKRMSVVNPEWGGAWPGPMGLLMKAIRREYEVPRASWEPPEQTMQATGSRAVAMAWLYLVLGTAFVGLGVFDLLLRNDLLSFLFE